MKKITIAYDGLQHAKAAVAQVKKLSAGFPDLEIMLLSVTNIAKLKDQALELSEDAQEKQQQKKQKIIDSLADILPEPAYLISLLYGDPATEILVYIKKNPVDMLVIGSRGLNAIQEFVMGSVSHKVVKYATVPVLVVK